MITHPDFPGYAVSADPALIDIQMVHGWLSGESYWARDIPMQTLKRAIDHSTCFGLYFNGTQTGFARVVSDHACFAYLADVFVLEPHRGKGLARWMIEVIQAHPSLQGLRRWLLMTRDAHQLYESCGWEKLNAEQSGKIMQRHFPGVYTGQ